MIIRLFGAVAAMAITLASAGETQKATLDVKGMDCAACPVTVKVVLGKQAGVADVKMDARQNTAVVTFDPTKVSAEALAKVVTDTGYPTTVRR